MYHCCPTCFRCGWTCPLLQRPHCIHCMYWVAVTNGCTSLRKILCEIESIAIIVASRKRHERIRSQKSYHWIYQCWPYCCPHYGKNPSHWEQKVWSNDTSFSGINIIWKNLFRSFPMHTQLVYHHVGTRWVWQYFHLCLIMRGAAMSTFCPPTALKLAWIKYTGFWNSQWIWAIRTRILSEIDRPEMNPFSSGLPLLIRILNSARESVVEHFTKHVWLNPISGWSPTPIQFGWPCIWSYFIFLYHSHIMCILVILCLYW